MEKRRNNCLFVVRFNKHGEEMVPMKEKYGNCLRGELAFVYLIDCLFVSVGIWGGGTRAKR